MLSITVGYELLRVWTVNDAYNYVRLDKNIKVTVINNRVLRLCSIIFSISTVIGSAILRIKFKSYLIWT